GRARGRWPGGRESVVGSRVFFFQAEDGIRGRNVWSSDVCSSDLVFATTPRLSSTARVRPPAVLESRGVVAKTPPPPPPARFEQRSGERRVGKEWRSRSARSEQVGVPWAGLRR